MSVSMVHPAVLRRCWLLSQPLAVGLPVYCFFWSLLSAAAPSLPLSTALAPLLSFLLLLRLVTSPFPSAFLLCLCFAGHCSLPCSREGVSCASTSAAAVEPPLLFFL